MWTKTRSLFLSRIMTAVMTVLILIASFFVPAISEWYGNFSQNTGLLRDLDTVVPLCITLYVCEALALAALYSLHVLLRNISRDQVFIPANTACLRRISWICIFAGCVLSVFGLWRSIFFLAAFLAIMFGLIMRVLKNVFEKAVEIKSENDFTI